MNAHKTALLFSSAALVFAASSASAQEVYGKAGLLGIGLGYAQGINENFGARADVTTAGRYKFDGTASDFDYDAKVRNDVATAYADWFPFANGFRLSAGLGVRNSKVTADGTASGTGTITIGDTTVSYGPDDNAHAEVSFPKVAPYLGIGWGHNAGQRNKGGFGFVADLGVYFGRPDVSFDVSQSLYTKLDLATGGNAEAEIQKQRDEIDDKARKLKVFPAVYVGLSYTF